MYRGIDYSSTSSSTRGRVFYPKSVRQCSVDPGLFSVAAVVPLFCFGSGFSATKKKAPPCFLHRTVVLYSSILVRYRNNITPNIPVRYYGGP